MDGQDERRPLLAPDGDSDLEQGTRQTGFPRNGRVEINRAPVFTYLSLILFTMSIARYFTTQPMYGIQLDIICHDFLSANITSGYDENCRDSGGVFASEVIMEYDLIKFWDKMILLGSGILVALPYGLVADRQNRKQILILSVGGMILSQAACIGICFFSNVFPLRLVWLSSLITVVGGGPITFFATAFAIAADITSGKRMSRVFLYLGSVTIAGSLLAVYIIYLLTRTGEWIAVFLGLATFGVCLCLTLFIQDTHEVTFDPDGSDAAHETSYLTKVKNMASIFGKITPAVSQVGWRLGALLLTVLLAAVPAGNAELDIDVLSHPSLVILLIWTALLLPGLSMIPFHRSPLSRDLWLARIILAIACGAALLFAFGYERNSIISGRELLGMLFIPIVSAYPYLLRSILVQFAAGKNTAVLFALMGVFEGVAALTEGPLFHWFSEVGDHLDLSWSSFAWIPIAVLLGVSGLLLFTVWPKRSNGVAEQERDE